MEWKRQVPEDSIRIGRHINMREAVEEILKEKLGSGPKNIGAGIIDESPQILGKMRIDHEEGNMINAN